MIRLTLASLIGTGIIRYAFISVKELPKPMSFMLTAITFMALFITLPPFLDAAADLDRRTNASQRLIEGGKQIIRSLEELGRVVQEQGKAIGKSLSDMSVSNCGAAAFSSTGHVSYTWGTRSCHAALGAAQQHCGSQCSGWITGNGVIVVVTCHHRNYVSTFGGKGSSWVSAESSALTVAAHDGFPSHSCTRRLVLDSTRGKIG